MKKNYEVGSSNVFKDIGVPNTEEPFVKAQLVFKIDTIMRERRMKQLDAAKLLGIRQPDISKMLRGASGSSPLNGFYVFLWRSITMLKTS